MSKVALVTGSTSGIGKVIAKKFCSQGYNVAITGLGTDEEIEKLLIELREYNTKVEYFSANLMEPEACKKLIVEVSEFFGDKLDILVNNAGMQYVASLEDFPDEKWAQVLQLNLSSCFYTTKQVLPIMRANGFGRIINIASTHGIVASCNKAAYVASKHGLIGLTKVTALETATDPITCNAVCPGFVYTQLVENQIVKKANEEGISVADAKINLVSEKHPSKEYVDMEDLSELVYFLTQDCAKQIRGSAYVIDGGWTAI